MEKELRNNCRRVVIAFVAPKGNSGSIVSAIRSIKDVLMERAEVKELRRKSKVETKTNKLQANPKTKKCKTNSNTSVAALVEKRIQQCPSVKARSMFVMHSEGLEDQASNLRKAAGLQGALAMKSSSVGERARHRVAERREIEVDYRNLKVKIIVKSAALEAEVRVRAAVRGWMAAAGEQNPLLLAEAELCKTEEPSGGAGLQTYCDGSAVSLGLLAGKRGCG
eukprot:5504546-Amphidinium_carterae.1